jgi:hypothetical protein
MFSFTHSRMSKKAETQIPKATHYGELEIGGVKLGCAVLDDGTRVFSEKAIALALNQRGGGSYWQKRKEKGATIPQYLSHSLLSDFIDDDMRLKLSESINYESKSGTNAIGIRANLLPIICDIWIKAYQNGASKFTEKQKETAEIAYILLKGFALVGVTALIDEVTGYQNDREKYELQKILKAYISEELLAWQKTFHDEFYKQIFRLNNWDYTARGIKSRPGVVGLWTNQLIYLKLPNGVLHALKISVPKTSTGKDAARLHQKLTADEGREHLKLQINAVTTLMSVSDNWDDFMRLFNKKFGQLALPFSETKKTIKIVEIIANKDFDQTLKAALAVPAPVKTPRKKKPD